MKKLGHRLANIRRGIIKPYNELETEEEKKKYLEKHPEYEEVIETISDIDSNCGNDKQKELAKLLKEDIKKRQELRKSEKQQKSE